MTTAVDTAVILAAGVGSRLSSELDDRPKGLLALGDEPIIEESICRLTRAGIERIVLVTGHMHGAYEEFASAFPGLVTTAHNELYRESGSMYSLYCARDLLDGDFLLLESDLIYEQRALSEILGADESCVLLSGWTHAGDEVFVSAREGRLVDMSKDRTALSEPPVGELVGITKVSAALFRHMKDFAAEAFRRSLMVDYETDCLVGVAPLHPVACRVAEGLLWAEIDDPGHLARARASVYPAICARDAGLEPYGQTLGPLPSARVNRPDGAQARLGEQVALPKASSPVERPPVVLVGLDSLQGLQAARLLHERGVRVLAVAADLRHPACRTNTCERIVAADPTSPELHDTLEALGRSVAGEALLLPCQDKSVRAISRNRDALAEHFTIVLPPAEVVDLLMDKDAFYAYAAGKGLPVPTTIELREREDAVRAAQELDFPCLLKPRARTPEWDRNTQAKVFKVESPQRLLELYDECAPWVDRLMAQQWIDGGDGSLFSCNCYYDRDSRPLVTFVARKLRQWPPETGSSCLGEEVRNDVVLETTLSLFGALRYQGLGYLEMKRDARTGQHYVIEPNVGRPTGRSAIAEAGGVALLHTMYCDAMGLQLPPNRTQSYSGAKWIDLRHDMQSAFVSWRRGRLSLREWTASVRGRKFHAVLSRRDPMPFLFDLWRAVTLVGERMRPRLRN